MLTLAAVAANKGIQLTRLEVHTLFDTAATPGNRSVTRFENRIVVEGKLDARERAILFNSARTCDVTKILSGDVTVEDTLLVSEQESH